MNIGVYSDGCYFYQLFIYVICVEQGMVVVVMFFDNLIVWELVVCYLVMLKFVF